MAHYGTRTKKSRDDYGTPPKVYQPWVERFRLNLDAAATAESAILANFIGPDQDGLTTKWAPWRVWVNCPFSQIAAWTAKAAREGRRTVVVMLLTHRPETKWWRYNVDGKAAVVFPVDPRISFINPDTGFPLHGNNHPSAIALYLPGHKGPTEYIGWTIGTPIPPFRM